MKIEKMQVEALVEALRSWGHVIPAADVKDLIAEFDVDDGQIDENRVGKFSRSSLTSRQAALEILPRTGTQRRKIYDYVSGKLGGATREDIAIFCGLSDNSVRPRVKELLEGHWLVVSGERRNRQGKMVEILRVNQEKS